MKPYFLLILLILFAVQPVVTAQNTTPAAAPAKPKVHPVRFVYYAGMRYILLPDIARYYRLSVRYHKTGVILYSKMRRLEMSYKKREGAINGFRVYFLAPVLYLDKRAYISENDFLKVIDPIFRARLQKKHPVRTIMIDPGHGGSDPGAPGPILREKQINLLVALKLKRALEHLGFKVIMTRERDIFPSLSARSALCAQRKPDLFISIHCNSAGNKRVNGVETFLVTPPRAASTADKTPRVTSYPGNLSDRNNARLAYEIQTGILKFTNAGDRGIRHARFAVLRGATCPAVLIECGFLSNLEEGRKLAMNEYQNRLVAGIISGIARYAYAVR
ncbi:MAG: N-acetylmuramoyl-L-alanine amidase [Lentisphaeria bacterium]|nr:N-acetylmuramoyl-L-alanine amidase [Lentisphaeria bacterium]